jgi:hypothetical protein
VDVWCLHVYAARKWYDVATVLLHLQPSLVKASLLATGAFGSSCRTSRMVGGPNTPIWAVLLVEAIRVFKDGGFSKSEPPPERCSDCPPCSPTLECPGSNFWIGHVVLGVLSGLVVGGVVIGLGRCYGGGRPAPSGAGAAPSRRGGGVVDQARAR